MFLVGFARLSNVEFYHTGQEGWIEEYDPRFSLAYVATGTVTNVKPSKVTQCSFHNGFSPAIGAFGIGGLEILENVVYGTVGNGELFGFSLQIYKNIYISSKVNILDFFCGGGGVC